MWQIVENTITRAEIPGAEPVSLDELKNWIGVDFNDHDELITGMGKGARQLIERICNISILPKAITLVARVIGDTSDRVPMVDTNGFTNLVVKEIASDDTETTLTSGTDYYARGSNIRLSPGEYFISYTSVPVTVDENIKEAIKMEVAERYASRGENIERSGLSKAALSKLANYYYEWL